MSEPRTVVVGTTADYIDTIRNRYPGQALFMTAPAERSAAKEPKPQAREEILSDLSEFERAVAALESHCLQWKIIPKGVVCFDCESLELAAHIAGKLDLPFPSRQSVANCRNKFLSKQIWRRNGIPCPQAEIIRNQKEALEAMTRFQRPVIIKPLTGSGSELVFKCTGPKEVEAAFDMVQTRLADHPNQRMYRNSNHGESSLDSRKAFLMEAFVEGDEFSCDFIIDGDDFMLVRTAAKIPVSDQSVGIALAYVVPGEIPDTLQQAQLSRQFRRAANVLGIKRSLCMVDFIIHRNSAFLLELTPRPGGDCLPQLIRASSGLDMLGLALDFSTGKPITIPHESHWEKLVGMRILAESTGVVRHIDESGLKSHRSVRAWGLKAGPGHRVKAPPDDYDSRVLGHVVFEPHSTQPLLSQCMAIRSKIDIQMEKTLADHRNPHK